ncbi:MAG: hypothetical protein K2J20_00370, partial [Bacilli bacterium]|nr:hypothetical protein [Bacilli bacterium]
MNVNKSSDNTKVQIINDEGYAFWVWLDVYKDFNVETIPCEGDVSFRIKATGNDEVEANVYKAFRELLDDIMDRYLKIGHSRLEMDSENRSIKTITHNPDYNNLEIELNKETEDVIIKIHRGATNYHNNNRVFLHRYCGTLAFGYNV